MKSILSILSIFGCSLYFPNPVICQSIQLTSSEVKDGSVQIDAQLVFRDYISCTYKIQLYCDKCIPQEVSISLNEYEPKAQTFFHLSHATAIVVPSIVADNEINDVQCFIPEVFPFEIRQNTVFRPFVEYGTIKADYYDNKVYFEAEIEAMAQINSIMLERIDALGNISILDMWYADDLSDPYKIKFVDNTPPIEKATYRLVSLDNLNNRWMSNEINVETSPPLIVYCYPSIVRSDLHIKTNAELYILRVINDMGVQQWALADLSQNQTISLDKLNRGYYWIKIESSGGDKYFKIFKM